MRLKRVYVSILLVSFFSSCSTKLPNSPMISSAITNFQKMNKDSSIENFAPKESFRAKNLYELLLKEKDLKKANHLAYLLEKEIKIAKNRAKIAKYKKNILILENKKIKEELLKKTKELERLKAEKKAVKASDTIVDDLKPQMTRRGLKFTFGDLMFEKDGSKLLLNAIANIDKLVDFLKEHPNRRVLIESYSDNSGSMAYNLDLSLRRADSIAKILKAKGIDKMRITKKGYGENNPIASNSTHEGRVKNRRVEVTILNEITP